MKKSVQVRRKDDKAATAAAQPKPQSASPRVRVRLRVHKAFHAAIKRGAKRCGLTISKFVELAILETLPLIEAVAKSETKGGAK